VEGFIEPLDNKKKFFVGYHIWYSRLLWLIWYRWKHSS